MKLVLLPGLDATGLLFQPLLKTLPKDIDVVVLSYPTDVLMTYDELVEYVYALLPKDNFILVAESFSGPIAYQLLQRKLSCLHSVIFVATFLESPRPLLSRLSTLFSPNQIRMMPDFMIKSFLLGRSANNEMLRLFKESLKKVSPEVLSFRLKELSTLNQSQNEVAGKTKATYIQASNDNLVLKKSLNDFKKVFSELEIFEVKGSHFILQTNPQACAKIICDKQSSCK